LEPDDSSEDSVLFLELSLLSLEDSCELSCEPSLLSLWEPSLLSFLELSPERALTVEAIEDDREAMEPVERE